MATWESRCCVLKPSAARRTAAVFGERPISSGGGCCEGILLITCLTFLSIVVGSAPDLERMLARNEGVVLLLEEEEEVGLLLLLQSWSLKREATRWAG